MKNQKKPLFHYAWVIMICGCCIVGINLGVIAYTIGNFYLPMSLELGVGVGDVAFYQTMQAFASALTFPTARNLMHKYGIRKVLTCATISAVLGFCAVFAGCSAAFSCSASFFSFFSSTRPAFSFAAFDATSIISEISSAFSETLPIVESTDALKAPSSLYFAKNSVPAMTSATITTRLSGDFFFRPVPFLFALLFFAIKSPVKTISRFVVQIPLFYRKPLHHFTHPAPRRPLAPTNPNLERAKTLHSGEEGAPRAPASASYNKAELRTRKAPASANLEQKNFHYAPPLHTGRCAPRTGARLLQPSRT